MRYFYDYFFKVLRFLPLSNHSALSLIIEALADYLDTVREDVIYTQKQFLVEFADNKLITPFAIGRGITRSRYDTDNSFKERVVNAYKFNLLSGKERGIEEILSTYGFKGFRIVNYRLIDAERWAEFDVIFDKNKLFDDNYRGLYELINQYKPARSKIRQIIFPYSIEGKTYHASALRMHQSIRLE